MPLMTERRVITSRRGKDTQNLFNWTALFLINKRNKHGKKRMKMSGNCLKVKAQGPTERETERMIEENKKEGNKKGNKKEWIPQCQG